MLYLYIVDIWILFSFNVAWLPFGMTVVYCHLFIACICFFCSVYLTMLGEKPATGAGPTRTEGSGRKYAAKFWNCFIWARKIHYKMWKFRKIPTGLWFSHKLLLLNNQGIIKVSIFHKVFGATFVFSLYAFILFPPFLFFNPVQSCATKMLNVLPY